MKNLIIVLFVLIAGVMFGCSNKTEAPTEVTDNDNVTILEFELPDYLRDLDPVLEPGTPGSMVLYDSLYDVYSVRIVWGNIGQNDNAVDRLTDWSGKLWINGEALVVVHETILFEKDQDKLIPSDSHHSIGWISKTSNGVDGLDLRIFLRTDIVYIMAPMLMMETGPFSHKFDFGALADMDSVYRVDDHNSVAVTSKLMRPDDEPNGHTFGMWQFKDRSRGEFKGMMLDNRGLFFGHFGGRFFIVKTDDRVSHRRFEGEWKGRRDGLGGKMHGSWKFNSNTDIRPTNSLGGFRGQITNMEGSRVGSIGAEFHRINRYNDQLTFGFKGRWEFNDGETDRH